MSDWTYEVPEFAGLHSIDRSRYTWAVVGNWTRTFGTTVIDTQVASNRFFQDDLLKRLHEFKPTDMGLPGYLDEFCAAQNDCMLPVVNLCERGIRASRPARRRATAPRTSRARST